MRAAPYLPFLHQGPPDFIVGLRPIPTADWLLPDSEAAALPEKIALLRQRRDEVYRAAPEARASEQAVADALGASTYQRAVETVSDDFVILTPRAVGWIAISVCLCAPTFFSAEDAIGSTLEHLHAPVPDRLGPNGAQALGARIGRVFAGLAPDVVLERFNWTVQAGPDRFTPRGQPLRERAARASPEDADRLLHLRVERQTIRKLVTGDVLFTIRVAIDPLAPILAEATPRAAFAAAWRGAPAHVRAYKKWAVYDRLVEAVLGRSEQEAQERGV